MPTSIVVVHEGTSITERPPRPKALPRSMSCRSNSCASAFENTASPCASPSCAVCSAATNTVGAIRGDRPATVRDREGDVADADDPASIQAAPVGPAPAAVPRTQGLSKTCPDAIANRVVQIATEGGASPTLGDCQ